MLNHRSTFATLTPGHEAMKTRCPPGRPEAAKEVGRLGVLVAVQDAQALPPTQRCQLAHRRLARARGSDQQYRLLMLQRPAHRAQPMTRGFFGVHLVDW